MFRSTTQWCEYCCIGERMAGCGMFEFQWMQLSIHCWYCSVRSGWWLEHMGTIGMSCGLWWWSTNANMLLTFSSQWWCKLHWFIYTTMQYERLFIIISLIAPELIRCQSQYSFVLLSCSFLFLHRWCCNTFYRTIHSLPCINLAFFYSSILCIVVECHYDTSVLKFCIHRKYKTADAKLRSSCNRVSSQGTE